MLTPDELAAIPIFSTLSPVALADIERAAADIHLNAGEYAVYEGEPPALFVVLEGAIEVIKLVDGVERKLGMRLPRSLFGEIPLVYGAQFQAGFRAGRAVAGPEGGRPALLRHRRYVARACEANGRTRPRAHRRLAEACGGAAQCSSHAARKPLGQRLPRPSPLSRTQPDFLQLADAGRSQSRRPLARTAADRIARCCGSSTGRRS